MHEAWATNRKSWKPLCSRTAMTYLPWWKYGEMAHITGVLQWTVRSSSEVTGKEGGAMR